MIVMLREFYGASGRVVASRRSGGGDLRELDVLGHEMRVWWMVSQPEVRGRSLR